MALFEDIAKGVTPTGLAVSVGTIVLAPFLVPALSSALRPVAKGVLSTGISLYRQAAEPISKAVSGLVAEAQLELASAKTAAPVAAAAAMPAKNPAPKTGRSAHKEAEGHAKPNDADA